MPRDTLSRCPPTADVIPFPTASRVGKIRRVARHIVEGSEKAANYQWTRAVDGIRSQMEHAGIDEDTITTELIDFRACVEEEVARLYRTAEEGRGGAA